MKRSGEALTPLRRDLAIVAFAFAASLLCGWGLNLLRPTPLAFPYQTREARAIAAVEGTGVKAQEILLPAVRDAAKSKSAVFIDARESLFFEEGHLPGAVSLPVSTILAGSRLKLPEDRNQRLIVYCSGGDCEDSRIVARVLSALGFRSVFVYPGGWDEWSEAPR